MKKHYGLILVITGIIILGGCKKDVSAPSSNDLKNTGIATISPMSIPLTREEAKIIKEMFKQRTMLTLAERIAIVDSVKSATGRKITANAVATTMDEDPSSATGYYEAGDDTESFVYTQDQSSQVLFIDLMEPYVRLSSKWQQHQTFNIRRNKIMVVVPFQYDWKYSNTPPGKFYIARIWPDLPIQLLPEGPYWGEVTQVNAWYLNGGTGDPNWTSFGCPMTASAIAQEKRTEIIALSGAIKVSANTDLALFEAGVELETGFTVSSAFHIYNNYNLDVDGRVHPNQVAESNPMGGGVFFEGTCVVYQYGILKNQ